MTKNTDFEAFEEFVKYVITCRISDKYMCNLYMVSDMCIDTPSFFWYNLDKGIPEYNNNKANFKQADFKQGIS